MAGDAVGHDAKAKGALLGDADAVEALAVIGEVRAAALVEQVVAATAGMVLQIQIAPSPPPTSSSTTTTTSRASDAGRQP